MQTPILFQEPAQRENYRSCYWRCALFNEGCDFKLWMDVYDWRMQSLIEELWDEKEELSQRCIQLKKKNDHMVKYVRHLKKRMT